MSPLTTRKMVTGIAIGGALAIVIPLGVTATSAAWTDAEWAYGEVGTDTLDCGTMTGLEATGSGRFLSGELFGLNLDTLAALKGMRVTVAADGTAVIDPPTALNQGSTPPEYTYTNPLNVSALGGIAGLDLTGLAIGLPVGSAGALNQYAQASGLGDAAGAAGLVSNSGGLLVSQYRQNNTLPGPATVSLATVLPTVTGSVADPRLEVGALASSSVLDGCAALLSQLWGVGPVVSADRNYEIASFGLTMQSALVQQVVTQTNTAVTNLNTALTGLLGPTGGIATTVRTQLGVSVAGLVGISLGATTGTVSLSGLNLTGAVSPLLTQPVADDVVSIDLGTGRITVDLARLLNGPNGLNSLAPNTELVLNAAVVNNILNRVDTLLATRITQITNALNTAVRAATLTINLETGLNLMVLGSPVAVAKPTVTLNATLGSVMDGTAPFTVALNLLPGAGTLLGALLTPLTNAISGLTTSLVTPVANTVKNAVTPIITGLGTSLTTVRTQLVSALGTVLSPLPGVLSIRVNVQPDQPFAPDPGDYIPASDRATAEYKVTALRVGLLDTLGRPSALRFATSTAGPVTAP